MHKILQFFSFLIISTPLIYAATHDQNQELLEAAKHGNIARVTQLLKVPGIDVNVKDGSWDTPALIHAIQNSRTEIAKRLVDAGADVNAVGYYHVTGDVTRKRRVTPLDMATLRQNREIYDYLVRHGATKELID